MKKSIILLVSALLSVGTIQAAKKVSCCFNGSITLTTDKVGDKYHWYKNGVLQQTFTTNEPYTESGLQADATYKCVVETNEQQSATNFLKSTDGIDYGDFEFHASQATSWDQYNKTFQVRDEIKGSTYNARIELKKFMQDGVCDAGESTTTQNPNDIKPDWFTITSAYKNNYMLAVDGPEANAGEFRFFEIYDMHLVAGQEYEFSCRIINIDRKYEQAGRSLPQLQFKLEDRHGNNLKSGDLFTIDPDTLNWGKYYVTYTPSQDIEYARLVISNQTEGAEGNDFAIDDVYFGAHNSTKPEPETEEFELTVYDTFEYEFKQVPVCPGETATIEAKLNPMHSGGKLEPTYSYEWKESNSSAIVGSANQLVVITNTDTDNQPYYILSTSSNVCYNSGAKSQSVSVKFKAPEECGNTSTDSKTYTPCVGQTCPLSPKNAGNPTWQTRSGDPVEDLEISIEDLEPITYICIVETTDADGHPLTITETHTITPKDCDEEHISEICNFKGDSTLVATFVGNDYVWNGPNVETSETEPNKLTINVVKGQVGSVLKYTCDVYIVDTNSDISHPTGRPPVYVGTDIFKITIVDCTDHTSGEQTKQVEKGGSITISVPNEHKCNGCEYHWYKIVDGEEVEIVKNPQYSASEHTIENAQESVYVCKVYKTNGNTHTITYNIQVLDTISVCYDPSSEDEQTKTIEGIKGDSDNHTWLWEKDGTTIPFPADYAKTENNIITLDLSKFATGSLPTNVKIIHEYENLETTPEPEDPEEEEEEEEEDIIGANKMKINVDLENVLSMSQFDGNKTITVDEYTQFIISDNYEYAQKFDTKNDEMKEHKGVLRVTDKGLGETIAANPAEGKVNDYFIDIDGGSKEGAMFTIKSTGKFAAGEKYLFTFLFVNTNFDTTKNQPELECILKTNTGETIVLAERFKIDKDYWHTWNKLFTIEEDAESVEITFSNYTTTPGQNDFAIDNIQLTADIPDYLKRAETRAIALKTWKEEITLIIKPYTKQDVTETSHPDKEYELDVKLTYNDKNEYVTFFYDPNVSYVEGMKQYVDYKEATNLYGCPHLVSFTLNLFSIKPDIFFTPNEDGINDKWMVEGIADVPDAHIMIYDRYSKLLFKGTGADFQGWDGTYNGHGMVQDDYWYVIQIPETDETLSGHFVLKR